MTQEIINEKTGEIVEIPFKCLITKKTQGQRFGNPKIIKKGQEIDVREWIQEGREDTEIYETLEKYGCLERMETNKKGIYADLTNIASLPNMHKQIEEADKLWSNLPLEIRNKFNNDKFEFMENGQQWLENQIKLEEPKTEPKTEEPKEQNNV